MAYEFFNELLRIRADASLRARVPRVPQTASRTSAPTFPVVPVTKIIDAFPRRTADPRRLIPDVTRRGHANDRHSQQDARELLSERHARSQPLIFIIRSAKLAEGRTAQGRLRNSGKDGAKRSQAEDLFLGAKT